MLSCCVGACFRTSAPTPTPSRWSAGRGEQGPSPSWPKPSPGPLGGCCCGGEPAWLCSWPSSPLPPGSAVPGIALGAARGGRKAAATTAVLRPVPAWGPRASLLSSAHLGGSQGWPWLGSGEGEVGTPHGPFHTQWPEKQVGPFLSPLALGFTVLIDLLEAPRMADPFGPDSQVHLGVGDC